MEHLLHRLYGVDAPAFETDYNYSIRFDSKWKNTSHSTTSDGYI